MSSRYCFCSCVGVRVYPFYYALVRAGQPSLATFCFVYRLHEVAMPSRQNVRNAQSRALRALETPEDKLVRRYFCIFNCIC